jgi:hypothetical protein
MSELIQKNDNRATIRWKLLTGASALTLAAYFSSASMAIAEDAGRPLVWIDLSGQLQQSNRTSDLFAPLFTQGIPASGFDDPVSFERFPRYSVGGEGMLTFRPEDSKWLFTASISYGRTNGTRHVHQQNAIPPTTNPLFGGMLIPTISKFVDTHAHYKASHSVIEFQVGRDVGLGLAHDNYSSKMFFGVREVNFTSGSNVEISGHPDFRFVRTPPKYFPHVAGYTYTARMTERQSFQGIGPSISWEASAAIAHPQTDAVLSLDWGLNAAVLFGRQKSRGQHQTTAEYYEQPPIQYGYSSIYNTAGSHNRSRAVTVAAVGGFAALSFRYSDAKVTFGYRADRYFGAMDGGTDSRKTYDQNFYGPYASISIGLGD